MSKFIDKIESQLTGKEKIKYSQLHAEFKQIPHDISEYCKLKEYVIGIEWKRKIQCEPKVLTLMIENCIRELREEIYGDIKERILRLERAVYEEDNKKAHQEMRDIIRETFGA